MNNEQISGNANKPLVSVVLPVYNCEKYIKAAIGSILQQSFQDFELIVIDDKSTDNTVNVIKSFTDPRLKLYLNEKNIGRAGSDNFALTLIRGKYIAKMDGDDICHLQRLEKQVQYLENNTKVNVVGTWVQNFGPSKFMQQFPREAKAINCKTLLTMPIGNPSVMFRSALFLNEGMRYDESFVQAEDYDFFARYHNQLHINVIQEPLMFYRTYPSGSREDIILKRKISADKIRRNFLQHNGFQLSETELTLLNLVHTLDQPLGNYTFSDIEQLFNKILIYNDKNKTFDSLELKSFLALWWFYVCYHYPQRNIKGINAFYQSSLSKYYIIPAELKIKFFYKGLRNLIAA